MSWITIIWSMIASACLMLALVHGLIWWWRREAPANGIFALLAVTVVLYEGCEIWMMRASTVEEFGRALWWTHLPIFVFLILLVGFVRVYLRAGRLWLAWAICGLRALALVLNFVFSPNINFREITALRHVRFLGESISVAEGIRNPWMLVGQTGLLLLAVFVVDAMITVWRRGDRRGARLLSIAITFFVLLGTGQALLVTWGLVQIPLTPSLFFSFIVLAMGFELGFDMFRAMNLAEDLTESELRFRTILEQAPMAISISRNGVNLYANQKFKELFGLQKIEQWVGSSLAEYFAPQCREEIKERIRRRALGLPVPKEYESVGMRMDGSQFPMQLTVAPIHLADGDANMGFVEDITERKRTDEALRQSEGKYRKIFENVQDVFYQTDNAGKIIEISPSIERYAGYGRQELIGKPVEEVYHNREDRAALLKILREKGEVVDYELRLKTKTGRMVYTSVNSHILFDSGGRPAGIEGSLRDITERRRAQEESTWKTAFLEAQVDSDLDGILVVDDRAKRILQNRRLFQLFKIPDHIIHDDDDAKLLQHVVKQTKNPEQFSERVAHLYAHPAETGRDEIELVDGTILDRYSAPVLDAMGKYYGRIWTFRDITDQRKLEAQLRQSQKMEGIGQLAGGVAHDFNNILASIIMQVELVGLENNLPALVKEGLGQIRTDAQRAANLTRQLLMFSRRQTMQPHILNLNDQVIQLFKMLQRIIGEDVHLDLHLHPTPLMTLADAGMLDQVLMNLVVNARDAMPAGGRLCIETAEKSLAAGEPLLHPDAVPGHFVCLSVSDTGPGIPPAILPRIFEPFFTTKAEGKGTGLGLATVYGIVKQHQGWIQLVNRPGQGVTFLIFLPASTAPAEKASGDTKLLSRRGTETILLVEDENGLLNLTRKILERHGYQVLTAANGPEALDQWKGQRATVALLLTDLVMPGGLSGQELARRLQAEQPQLKVIYTSGYSAEIAGREFKMRQGESFIQKPFAPGQLLDVVRESLDV